MEKALEVGKRTGNQEQDESEEEMLQRAINLSLQQEEIEEIESEATEEKTFEPEKEDVEGAEKEDEEGFAEELDSDEEMLQLAIAMSLAQD